VLSIDIPSGLFGEDNRSNSRKHIVRAFQTLTFEFPKLAFFLPENHAYVGEWKVIPIGLHPDFTRGLPTQWNFTSLEDARRWLKVRGKFSHKGSLGHSLLIAGSTGKAGAAVLAASACIRSGSGLTTVMIPGSANSIVQTAVPEAMTIPDSDPDRWTQIPDLTPFNSLGVGPGIGVDTFTWSAMDKILNSCRMPLVLDADALGLSIRAYSTYSPESELTKIASGAKPVEGGGAATLSGLPKSSFYLAAAIDAQALGGANKLDALTAALGVSDFVPAWLSQAKEGVRSIRFAAYPSKLGILAGGALNDCALLIETDQPQMIRDLFKSSLMAQAGKSEGVRKEPAWEDGRTLKNGTVADAFELKETPLGASEAEGADLSGVAMRQITRQAIFGSRGMHGFFKMMPKSVLITFSQRPDVLDRAIASANGGDSLKDESVLVAMRPWLVPGAQIEAFISVGQILKVVKQIADSFGGGGMALPSIPSRSPPIAIALRSDPQSFEAAVMIPTAVLAAGYDQILSSALGGGRTKQTDANKAETDGGNVKIAP
jgi:hypothetical protein